MPLTAQERKARIQAIRGKQAEIAARLRVNESTISRCVNTGEGSRKVKRAVAQALRCTIAEAFPPEPVLQQAS